MVRTKAKIIIFPVIIYGYKSWTVNANRKKMIHFKRDIGGELYGYSGPTKSSPSGS